MQSVSFIFRLIPCTNIIVINTRCFFIYRNNKQMYGCLKSFENGFLCCKLLFSIELRQLYPRQIHTCILLYTSSKSSLGSTAPIKLIMHTLNKDTTKTMACLFTRHSIDKLTLPMMHWKGDGPVSIVIITFDSSLLHSRA